MIDAMAWAAGLLTLANMLACLCRLDPMHSSTHRPWPMARWSALGILSALAWLGAAKGELQPAAWLLAEAAISLTLLLTLRRYIGGSPHTDWRDSALVRSRASASRGPQ
jgi:hypothetical protein